ncbi:MAG: galactokinase [Bacteroidetes bacterium]|nr:MAG: galactokinase [Bacteroidota bacterium]GIV57888.1 MAG: galactokinase [Rhodothermaceae bacterium]
MKRPLLPPIPPATPPIVRSYLDALDRLQQRETLKPVQVTERAQHLLDEYLGPRTVGVEAAFAHGRLSVLGDHTDHFDGFALMRPLMHGQAVAVRPADGPVRVVLEGAGAWTWTADMPEADLPVEVRLLAHLVRPWLPPGQGVDAAVAGSVPLFCPEARLGALGMAAARALQALLARPEDEAALVRHVREALRAATGRDTSPAYLLGSDTAPEASFLLCDTRRLEHLPVEVPGVQKPGWGLLAVPAPAVDLRAERQRIERAGAALDLLRRRGFPELTSFRDLEHRDLERALGLLPRRYRPLVRHLVTQNRYVPRMVQAIRRADWQLFGTLLLMSHASFRDDWHDTTPEIDFVVEQVRALSLEGLYGAHRTGRGGGVLIVGQPFQIPGALDALQDAFAARFGTRPEALLL